MEPKGFQAGKTEIDPTQEMFQEIERKFLIAVPPPNLDQYPHEEVQQGYGAITADGTEVRLRKKGDRYFQTIKTGKGKTREETEIEISESQFIVLWKTTKGKRLKKVRYEVPLGQSTIELDVYDEPLKGLLIAEVEFASEKESETFVAPDWFGDEVTEDEKYKNQQLALHGLLKVAAAKQPRAKEKLNIPQFELTDGTERLKELTAQKLAQQTEPVVVLVAGGSASGKTSAVAAKLKEQFGDDAMIFSMDDYYRGKTFMEAEAKRGNMLNWDQPEALNLALFKHHLSELKAGRSIQKPNYSFTAGEPVGTEELKPHRVIIVEGLFALDDGVADEGNVKAFVDIGPHGRILRRLLRDVERTGQKPADILAYFAEVVEPMHDKYIESTKRNADLIINNEYSPTIEAERSGLHEIQIKFAATFDMETLRKLGAERLGSVTQVDTYYNPRDRNLVETGEILRIREEGGHRILTYKGPKVASEYRERPKFEFEINDEMEKKFLDIYGDCVKIIYKNRTFYQLDGVVFSMDEVSKVEKGKRVGVGSFIELRSTNKDVNPLKLQTVFSKLGFDPSQGIKDSYFEM